MATHRATRSKGGLGVREVAAKRDYPAYHTLTVRSDFTAWVSPAGISDGLHGQRNVNGNAVTSQRVACFPSCGIGPNAVLTGALVVKRDLANNDVNSKHWLERKPK